MAGKRFILGFILGLALVHFSWPGPQTAQATCGGATCFLTLSPVVGVYPAGTANVIATYSYAPQNSDTVTVAGALMNRRQVVLNGHRIADIVNHRGQLDFNYGVTDRFTVQLSVPVVGVTHKHPDGAAHDAAAEGKPGLAEVRLTGKYALVSTLRSSIVTGFGVEFPTSDLDEQNLFLQAGRRQAYGVVGQLYQTYELIPGLLSQFTFFSYRHSFENRFDYQFGDEYTANAGLNLKVTERVGLAGQVNYRYVAQDRFRSSLVRADHPDDFAQLDAVDATVSRRAVPNTGLSIVMFSPGVSFTITPKAVAYVFAQVPLVRDFNGNLEQGVSYLAGLSYTF